MKDRKIKIKHNRHGGKTMYVDHLLYVDTPCDNITYTFCLGDIQSHFDNTVQWNSGIDGEVVLRFDADNERIYSRDEDITDDAEKIRSACLQALQTMRYNR